MFTLGVTGGIGSGKTTVCRLLESRGASVFYADEEARALMVEDAVLRQDIMDAFGAQAYLDDGALNRSYLAGRVFARPEELNMLNRLVHPRVAMAFGERKSRASRDGVRLLIKEAALLLETRSPGELDAVLVVTADDSLRIARVRERDGLEEPQIQARMQRQWSQDRMVRAATYLIENDGGREDLEPQVDILWRTLVSGT